MFKAAQSKSQATDRPFWERQGIALVRHLSQHEWRKKAALFLVVAVIISASVTYAALSANTPFGRNSDIVIWLLNLDLILLLLLVMVIARRIVALWSGRKRKLAGSHLHVRLVFIFSVLAAAPAIVMTVFSALFFHFGVQTWFSDRVETAVNESQAVAEAYLEEHTQAIRADTLAMAGDLDRQASFLLGSGEALDRVVQTQSVLRNLSEAIVFDSSGRVVARSGLTFSLEFEQIPLYAMQSARDGEVVIMTGGNEDRVRALVRLENYADSFLFVGRMVDPVVLSHLAATRKASQEYADLQERFSDLQIISILIFVVIGLVLVMGAIWFGLILARQLVEPISLLITTADRVRAGDMTARVPEAGKLDEFDYLARAFNRMTRQIEEQQGALLLANRQLDQRRKITETVLTGVTSGIIGVDDQNIINLANAAAAKILSVKESEMSGRVITDDFPAIADLLAQAHEKPDRLVEAEIPLRRADGKKRTYLVRIVVEVVGEEDVGAIVTFDDITDLQSAQRKAAWADVARRIAHEIKNPLTPIQLSAERIRRKYLSQIQEDRETFEQCTQTIIKNVEDIGRMVNEFSDFARMPEAALEESNLDTHIQETLALHRHAHENIAFSYHNLCDGQSTVASFDPQQIRQALNNLIQNAVDSIEMAQLQGQISVSLALHSDLFCIIIADNGPGLPQGDSLASLTEPYVTHKEKGTGLGLAIVKKIADDHAGHILLGKADWMNSLKGWIDPGGAVVALMIPAQNNKIRSGRASDVSAKARAV